MKSGREEKTHETSPWPTRLGHDGDMNIPLDLKVEILKKLPAKSLVRFRSVSKQWSSIISSRRDFIESIVTRSLTQPPRDAHILFDNDSGRCFLALSSTTTCPRNTNKELLSVPKQGHYQSVRGLICCWLISHRPCVVAIYNPTTRQSFYLPEVKAPADRYGGNLLFGYDPLKNQYKVVFLATYAWEKSCQVFTLGDAITKEWRTIKGFCGNCVPSRGVVCINGTIYYQEIPYHSRISKLMSFDVRSERFHHVEAPTTLTIHQSTLINYQGKLGFICCENGVEIWVMETQGWSNIFFCEMEGFQQWRVSGVTRGGEIVFNIRHFSHRLCVYYYDPKRNSMRYVDLQDYYTEEGSRNSYMQRNSALVLSVPDHVENTMCLELYWGFLNKKLSLKINQKY